MKKILIITERRADFSRFKPIIKLIQKDKKLDYQLIVTGLHLVKKYGYTVKEINKDKFKIFSKFKMFDNKYFIKNDGAEMVRAIGKVFLNISHLLKKAKPDLILSGFDIAANFGISVAGAHMNIPVAHIQGGEVSGTIDESIRHATSKFSNFHFTANKETRNRLIKLGEIPKNIFPVGCPSIDALLSESLINKKLIKKKFKIDLDEDFLVVIQHPVTSEQDTLSQINKTLSVVKNSKMQHLVVFPNNDSGSKKILQEIKKTNLNYVPTLTLSEYRTLLGGKMILLGNSSSGIHEAASFKVPVINIGSRQSGRYKPINVINVNYNKKEIENALKKVKSQIFYKKIKNIKNPYGDGKSALKIIQIIKKLNLKNFNTQKKLTY
jgi:GDP/UDP-N,N'-diacetylbacillosamine 2-epimerase (hydrolysing)|tara:strand:+ start:561 stop:1700 length:1140 start_codon:yes stop_codon:yes gene_type:complete